MPSAPLWATRRSIWRFCINHLILKSVHRPGFRNGLIESAAEFWNVYSASVSWEPVEKLERRAASLLPALMLARVDGKSPVEYLSDRDRERVRAMAIPLILKEQRKISDVLGAVRRARPTFDE